jgi:hypothetical protein
MRRIHPIFRIVDVEKRGPSTPHNLLILLNISIFSGIFAAMAWAPGEEIRYGTGTWNPGVYGNHRAVVRVVEKADAVSVYIPWRRRDSGPEKKNVIFVDAATGERIKNVCPVRVNRESGEFIFQPATAPGDYHVYYLAWVMKGRSNYPTVVYPEMELTTDEGWLKRLGLAPFQAPAGRIRSFPQASLVEFQSTDEFNSFYPMEVIATAQETADLVARFPDASYLLFPEDRRYSIRMSDDLPFRWIQRGPSNEFAGEALRGEFYVFQIGVFACRADIEDIDVVFDNLKPASALPRPAPDFAPSAAVPAANSGSALSVPLLSGIKAGDKIIPASGMHSFNTRGVNWDGSVFKKVCPVLRNKIQPLWCGVQVPRDIAPGRFEGEVTVSPKGLASQKVKLILDVKREVLEEAGDGDLWRMSRLRWLDSRIAFDDEIVPPFTPLAVQGRTVSCLGRSLQIDGTTGLPAGLTSFFSPEVTGIRSKGRDLLASPIDLVIEDAGGDIPKWQNQDLNITKQAPGAVGWRAECRAGSLLMSCLAQMEADGFVAFKVALTAAEAAAVNDLRLEIPLAADAARYMMGLGFKGGFRPAKFIWKWDQKKNQDALWIGDVNAGLQVSLRDKNYSRPLNTNFYLSKPLNLPPSWWNEGKGGVALREKGSGVVLLKVSSGPRSLKKGETLHFNFNLLLTPFKCIDSASHFKTRFFHSFQPVEEVVKTGANTINVHHANAINPYINFPFLRPAEMKAYIDEAHGRGMKVKIYNTIRELSNRAFELFALRSLGEEIFSPGPGGGFSWLQEHLGSNYIAAWFVPELKDAAIINSGMSRWHNYYLEGLNWLVRNVGIDGLYIDDLAFDRTTMKRLRKILDRGRPGALIDLHSANQYNVRDGFASSVNLYLEHFPYLNRLWFGEYFDYNSAPDYWLIEISGIPFGLMGEMLQDGGNAWRGMIYGITNRLPWSGQNPARLWKVWDEFGIEEARMIGYWSPNCPVKTDHPDVLATVYVKKGSALVALASWAKVPVQCRLNFDWNAIGIDPQKAVLYAVAIDDFQPEASFGPGDPILVEPGKGWLLIIK